MSDVTTREHLGFGYYRQVWRTTGGNTVIKEGLSSGGDVCNRNEYEFYIEHGHETKTFKFDGNAFNVRVAQVLDAAKDFSWIEMEYVPNSGTADAVIDAGFCMNHSTGGGRECGSHEPCFTCMLWHFCEEKMGIIDIHHENFGVDVNGNIVLIDYGGCVPTNDWE